MLGPGWTIAAVLVVAVGPARAACTPDQIQAFIDRGISNATIEQACGGAGGAMGVPPAQSVPSVGQMCLTNLGTCALLVPGYVGQSCTCPSVWGPVVGSVR
jgi:hypothetical protein